jgi:hypothetical protein
MPMQASEILAYLEDLAEKLGVEVIYAKLAGEDFPVKSGLCRVRGLPKIFLDRSESLEKRIEVLAKALSTFDTEGIYLRPHIRGILEQARRSS